MTTNMDDNVRIVSITRDSKEFSSYCDMIVKQWGKDVLEEVGTLNKAFDIRHPDIYVLIDDKQDVLGGMVLHEMHQEFFLTYLIIKRELRGKGYGTTMLQRVKRISEDANKDVSLYAESWNEQSRKFYEKNGWVYLWDEKDENPGDTENLGDQGNTNVSRYCYYRDPSSCLENTNGV